MSAHRSFCFTESYNCPACEAPIPLTHILHQHRPSTRVFIMDGTRTTHIHCVACERVYCQKSVNVGGIWQREDGVELVKPGHHRQAIVAECNRRDGELQLQSA